MASPASSVPSSTPTALPSAVGPVSPRPVPARSAPGRPSAAPARGPQAAGPAGARRDQVRPGGRPARTDGVTTVRPVRGGCAPETSAPRRPATRATRYDAVPAPLRLTRRGRRMLSGLSITIGLSLAVVTAAVELGQSDGGLELAGSSTVVVQSGDTLWTLAEEVAPDQDPRAVIDAIVDVNGLRDVDLVPGMVLELP